MPRLLLPNYDCPRCGFDTALKGGMNKHLMLKKRKCPALRNDIELTDDIKQYILQNRIYKIPKKRKEIKIEKRYPCKQPDCNITFKSKSDLKDHIKISHPHQPPQITPLQPSNHTRKEEAKIFKLLTVNFKREHKISFNCSIQENKYARIDFLIIKNGVVIFLEIDENQHNYGKYEIGCDMKRMASIQESLICEGNTMPVYFIRYNPNKYSICGYRQSTKIGERHASLLDVVNSIGNNCNNSTIKPLTILYMYYDVGLYEKLIRLNIHYDLEYNETIKKCCIEPIF